MVGPLTIVRQVAIGVAVVVLLALGAACSQEGYEATLRRAEQGDADAQYSLGNMNAEGRGVARDDAEAVRWYRLAAEQGDADAQYSLGNMNAEGRGVARDDAEAVRWYRLAAEQGDPTHSTVLGTCTPKVGAWRGTTPKPSGGTDWRPSRATPTHSTVLGT